MTYDQDLRDLWGEFDDVSIELAQVRDSYVALKGEEKKFNRLAHDWEYYYLFKA